MKNRADESCPRTLYARCIAAVNVYVKIAALWRGLDRAEYTGYSLMMLERIATACGVALKLHAEKKPNLTAKWLWIVHSRRRSLELTECR